MARDLRCGDHLLRQLGDFEFVHSVFPSARTVAPRGGEELRLAVLYCRSGSPLLDSSAVDVVHAQHCVPILT